MRPTANLGASQALLGLSQGFEGAFSSLIGGGDEF